MTLDDWSHPMYLHMATADLSPFAIVRLDRPPGLPRSGVNHRPNEPCSDPDRGRLSPSEAQCKVQYATHASPHATYQGRDPRVVGLHVPA